MTASTEITEPPVGTIIAPTDELDINLASVIKDPFAGVTEADFRKPDEDSRDADREVLPAELVPTQEAGQLIGVLATVGVPHPRTAAEIEQLLQALQPFLDEDVRIGAEYFLKRHILTRD